MQSCKNIMESLVISEVDSQISQVPPHLREQINLSEVAAYALNRLPPMYATSETGWVLQRQKVQTEMRQTIESNVRRALMNVKQDALRDSEPLPHQEVENHAKSLSALQEILAVPNASWTDIPTALENAFTTIKLKRSIIRTYATSVKREAALAKNEQFVNLEEAGASWKSRVPEINLTWAKDKEKKKALDNYLSDSRYEFSNVLEKLVLSLVYYQVQKLDPKVADTIDLGEVVAYVLNRLPAMYATSKRGYQALRLRAREVYGKQVVDMITQAIKVCLQSPKSTRSPLPIVRFEAEIEDTISKLNWMLQRDDINWRNAPFIIEGVLQDAIKDRNFTWRKPSEYEY